MAAISDILLILSAISVALYCGVLSRRLKRLTSADGDIAQSISRLSDQLENLTRSTKIATEVGELSATALRKETTEARAAARHLELLMASLHGLPKATSQPPKSSPFSARKTDELVVPQ